MWCTDDAGRLGDASDRLGLDVGPRAARHVVEQHGQVHGLGHELEVVHQPLLRRLDVVRRHHQAATHNTQASMSQTKGNIHTPTDINPLVSMTHRPTQIDRPSCPPHRVPLSVCIIINSEK